jgi:predicted secreted hydrolase
MRAPRVLALAAALMALGRPATAGDGPVRFGPDGFRLAVPPYAYEFPRDHASHPGYAVEWWYYTGHLAGGARRFGYELTFFRVAVARLAERRAEGSAWRTRDVLFAHLALTDETGRRFRHVERASRPALGMAGAGTAAYRVWIGDWSASLAGDGRTHRLEAGADEFALALDLSPSKPPAVHGAGGVSQKAAGEGNASHYYSLTRLVTTGTLVVAGDTLAVTGSSWMDHEYGSGRLAGTHAGWDWLSLQLDDGRELMVYRLRRKDGSPEPLSAGTLVERDGRTRHLALADFDIAPTGRWKSPATGGEYPSGWRVRVPGEGLDLTLEPTLKEQELVSPAMGGIAYWEGSCTVRGTSRGAAVTGRAYVELTGYAGPPPF